MHSNKSHCNGQAFLQMTPVSHTSIGGVALRGYCVQQTFADAKSIAAAFVDARHKAHALAEYPGSKPTSLPEALAVQTEALALYDGVVAGWKVGRIHSPWFEKVGVNRLPGPIFAHSVQQIVSSETPVGTIFENGFGAVEAEFIFRIGHAPAAGQRQFRLDETAALIDGVSIGIEIASSPFAGINSEGPLVTISDFGNNNGLIVGQNVPDWRASDLDNWSVEARIDGTLVGQGQAASFPDGPLGSVKFLIENLIARAIPINPGLLISTGAVTGVHEISEGQRFEARFGAFGTIGCTIAYATA
jgi:2-keto-4-pentenoate hydratase